MCLLFVPNHSLVILKFDDGRSPDQENVRCCFLKEP